MNVLLDEQEFNLNWDGICQLTVLILRWLTN